MKRDSRAEETLDAIGIGIINVLWLVIVTMILTASYCQDEQRSCESENSNALTQLPECVEIESR